MGIKFYIHAYSSNLLLSYIAERALQPILEGLLDQVRKLDGFDNFILPSPKIPENNDIKPSGHNYTRPTEAVFINTIPPGVDILQKSYKKCQELHKVCPSQNSPCPQNFEHMMILF